MKTSPLEAHRATLQTVIFGPMNLATRRGIGRSPLRKQSRLLDQSTLARVSRECEGVALVEYYGHPSRRSAIAYPLPGHTLEETRNAVRNAFVTSGSVSCGHYVFSLASL